VYHQRISEDDDFFVGPYPAHVLDDVSTGVTVFEFVHSATTTADN